MKVLNIIYSIYIIAVIAVCIWFLASWADVVINPLRQEWNFFDLVLSYT